MNTPTKSTSSKLRGSMSTSSATSTRQLPPVQPSAQTSYASSYAYGPSSTGHQSTGSPAVTSSSATSSSQKIKMDTFDFESLISSMSSTTSSTSTSMVNSIFDTNSQHMTNSGTSQQASVSPSQHASMTPSSQKFRATPATNFFTALQNNPANGATSDTKNQVSSYSVASPLSNSATSTSSISTQAHNVARRGSSAGSWTHQQTQQAQLNLLQEDLEVILKHQKDENANRRLRLQLYVFVLRCVSYPYNAHPIDIDELASSRQQQIKVTLEHLKRISENHSKYVDIQLNKKTSSVVRKYPHQHLVKLIPNQQATFKNLDELYDKCHFVYNKKFFTSIDSNSRELLQFLVRSNACSLQDIRDSFKTTCQKIIKIHEVSSGLASLFKLEPSSREIILNSWMSKFEQIILAPSNNDKSNMGSSSGSGVTTNLLQLQQQALANSKHQFSKDFLYQMFQTVLNIKKFEHQLLFNALQLDSADEQTAAVRRELDNRIQRIVEFERNKKLLIPRFVLKEMESLYLDEERASIQQLMINLDKMPVIKSQAESRYGLQKFRKSAHSQSPRAEHSGAYVTALPLPHATHVNSSSSSPVCGGKKSKLLANKSITNASIDNNRHTLPKAHDEPTTRVKLKLINSRYDSDAEKLKTRRPIAHFMLSSAQLPLWAIASRSVFKMAKVVSQASGSQISQSPTDFAYSDYHQSAAATTTTTNSSLAQSSSAQQNPQAAALCSSSSSASPATAANAASSSDTSSTLKSDCVSLSFNLEVVIMEARGLKQLNGQREVYCTMEVEGSEKLQTEKVLAKKPLWHTQGDFVTSHPLPLLKVKLFAVSSRVLSLDDKELGRVLLRPTVALSQTSSSSSSSSMSTSMLGSAVGGAGSGVGGGSAANTAVRAPEWYALGASGSSTALNHYLNLHSTSLISSAQPLLCSSAAAQDDSELRLKLLVRMHRPQQLKHAGFLLGAGKGAWRKFKRRYHVLVQQSQYNFLLCSYKEKKSKPSEMLNLSGYTVDFVEAPTDLIMHYCTELTCSNDINSTANYSATSGCSQSSSFGLAGRLAQALLKQQGLSSSSADSSCLHAASDSASNVQSSETGPASLSTGSGSQQLNCQATSTLMGLSGEHSAIKSAAILSDELHNKFYFNVVREGDSVVFACDDEQEAFYWVMALYRATGQAHKPTPLASSSTLGGGVAGVGVGVSHSGNSGVGARYGFGGGVGSACGDTGSNEPNATVADSSSSNVPNTAEADDLLSAAMLPSVPSSSLSQLHQQQHQQTSAFSASSQTQLGMSKCIEISADQRARRHGMDEFIRADVCKFNHNTLFRYLLHETLRTRLLNDVHCSLGWLSVAQVFVLDEYCARYGVRTCYRHLAYLGSLLEFNEHYRVFIDHTLLSFAYDFCALYVAGNTITSCSPSPHLNAASHPIGGSDVLRLITLNNNSNSNSATTYNNYSTTTPNTAGTVTVEERDMFASIKARLLKLLEAQLSDFVRVFALGKPDGALKAALSLLERVLMRQEPGNSGPTTPVSSTNNEAVRQLIRKCLDEAALRNYTYLSERANLAGVPQTIDRLLAQATRTLSASALLSSSSSSLASGEQKSLGARDCSSASTSSSLFSFAFTSKHTPFSSLSSTSSTNSEQQQRQQHQLTKQSQITLAMVFGKQGELMKVRDKLKYLLRLTELCAEFVEEICERFGDAFAWHSDLFGEHFELFWSLLGVDIDKILSEISLNEKLQTPTQTTSDTNTKAVTQPVVVTHREVFALFQLINNHMRKSHAHACPKFQAYLCDTFKPRLLRYLDASELICRNLSARAFEREHQIDFDACNKLFVKLDDLQRFVINELRWPNDALADRLVQRIKLMAFEMCDSIITSCLHTQQALEKRSTSKWSAATSSLATSAAVASIPTTTTIPFASTITSCLEMVQIINLILETRKKSLSLCTFARGVDQMQYHAKVDRQANEVLTSIQAALVAKLQTALDACLTKMARHDEGSLFAPLLSITYKQGMSASGQSLAKQYVSFVNKFIELTHVHVHTDDMWILSLLEDWYSSQMTSINSWLTQRFDQSLHAVQLSALSIIVQKLYQDMALQGLPDQKLASKVYQTVVNRLKVEETSNSAFRAAQAEAQAQASKSSSQQPASSRSSATPVACSANMDSISTPGPNSNNAESNLADRAFQSASRMLKGLWNN